MIPALIVCHGGLGEALHRALEGIYGDVEGLVVQSNDGLSSIELEKALAMQLDGLGDEVLAFTDYFGGSCAAACLASARERGGIRVISGVNLPMLLYYIAHRQEMKITDILRGLVHRGQNSIRELKPPSL